jgi:hypothetical protein
MHPETKIELIQGRIHVIRGQRVMLDMDLASLYGVPTKALNQSVRRNIMRFPADFMFRLNEQEMLDMRSQIVTAYTSRSENVGDSELISRRNMRALPYAFTEQGVAMLSSVLKSKTAIQMNIAIMRAFIATRQLAAAHGELLHQLAELTERVGSHDQQLASIYEAIENLLDDKADQQTWADRERIGFRLQPGKED